MLVKSGVLHAAVMIMEDPPVRDVVLRNSRRALVHEQCRLSRV